MLDSFGSKLEIFLCRTYTRATFAGKNLLISPYENWNFWGFPESLLQISVMYKHWPLNCCIYEIQISVRLKFGGVLFAANVHIVILHSR